MDGLLSLVIPVYNEADSLEPLVAEIDEALAAYGSPYEIVFVDDGSTDGSYAVMKGLAEARDDVRVVKLRRNFGKAAALSHGFAAARGDYLVTMDGDRQDDPAEIPNLTAPLMQGYDLVSGWKQRRQDPAQQDAPVALLQLDGAQAPPGSRCTTSTAASRRTSATSSTRSPSTASCTATSRSSPRRPASR